MSDALDSLRDEVSRLDRELIALAAARHAAVRRIAEEKRRSGGETPLFDRTREARVLRDAAAAGAAAGLPVGVAERLLRTLIDASHETQAALLREPAAADTAIAPPHVLVVGGGGEMGRLLCRTFAERGCPTDVLEAPGEGDDPDARARAVAAADVTILSVPMQRAVAVAGELAPHVRTDALLCDINSLKREICEVMARDCPGEVLGLHPMFGPTVQSLRRQKVVVCLVREGPRAAWLRAELGRMGVELIDSDPAAHDRMMAIVQVLLHYATLVMGEALRASGVPIEESLRFTSPIYRLELAITGRLFAQDADLYAEIEMENPYAAEIRRHFVEAATELDRTITSGDREAFRRAFTRTGEWFAGFSQEAMALSDAIIDDLVRRP